jgi:hypothetical protein
MSGVRGPMSLAPMLPWQIHAPLLTCSKALSSPQLQHGRLLSSPSTRYVTYPTEVDIGSSFDDETQIVLGVAAYGHSFNVPKDVAIVNSQLAPYPTFVKSPQPPGEGETADTKSECFNTGSYGAV